MLNEKLTWLSSGGGPLLLLSRHHLKEWKGTDVPTGGRVVEATFRWDGPDSPATDYDRACDVDGYVGVIPVGAGHAVVLGDEPCATAWYSRTAGDTGEYGLLVRWVHANDDEDVLLALDQVNTVSWEDTGLRFTVDQSPLVLFDSAQNPSWEEFEGSCEVPLPPGTYRIETAFHKPDNETFLILHRFVV
jgi:hypothetical protein